MEKSMGFEPFHIPKRAPEKLPDATREDKVLALAKMLHQRGITSSLTDAKRLAEGMVDVEKKVIKAPVKEEPKKEVLPPKASFGLNDDFAHFVAHAAALSRENVQTSVAVPERNERPVTYGREAQHTVSAVPHARTQVFFEDAPDLSKARGLPEKSTPLQQLEPASVTRVTAGDGGIKVAHVETAPNMEIVTEKVVVEAPEEKTLVKPQEDLAKQHGVDLFQMFKKK